MKGLTVEQLTEITAFVQKHHRFGYVAPEDRVTEVSFNIKYIDVCYDTRDQTFWSISFRRGQDGVEFKTNHFNAVNLPPKGWKYTNLYDLCMAYLNGQFKPRSEFFIKNK